MLLQLQPELNYCKEMGFSGQQLISSKKRDHKRLTRLFYHKKQKNYANIANKLYFNSRCALNVNQNNCIICPNQCDVTNYRLLILVICFLFRIVNRYTYEKQLRVVKFFRHAVKQNCMMGACLGINKYKTMSSKKPQITITEHLPNISKTRLFFHRKETILFIQDSYRTEFQKARPHQAQQP